jgi:hypothetical protein
MAALVKGREPPFSLISIPHTQPGASLLACLAWQAPWSGQLRCDDGEEADRHGGDHAPSDHSHRHALHGGEVVIHAVEAGFEAIEAPVDLFEALVDLLEAVVDLPEAVVDAVAQAIQLLVGPVLPHRLHDHGTLEDKTLHECAWV